MRGFGYYLLGNAADLALRLGEWEWAGPELEEAVAASEDDLVAKMRLADLQGLRGEDVEAQLEALAAAVAELTELQAKSGVAEVRAEVALAHGEFPKALEMAQMSFRLAIGPDGDALQTAGRVAAWVGDVDALREVLDLLEQQPGRIAAAAIREARAARAALDGRRGEALAGFLDAHRRYRELGVEVDAGICALNMVTMVGASEPEVRAVADETAALFERLGARPFQERLAKALRAPRQPVAASPADRAVETTVGTASE